MFTLPCFITLRVNDIFYSVFDCNDCRNYWLKKNQNITKRVTANCSNKKQLNDSDNFINCLFEFVK